MFADDIELDYCSPEPENLETKINSDLSNVSDYLVANRLSVNVTKTEFMLINRQRVTANIDIKINNEPLKQVSTAKYLGMHVDYNLKWTGHIAQLHTKISRNLGVLRRLRSVVPKHTLVTLYNTIVLPHFDYCDIIYDSADQGQLLKLQKLQNLAARLLLGTNRRAHREDMFSELRWLSLHNR
jgi:hypothetical protein